MIQESLVCGRSQTRPPQQHLRSEYDRLEFSGHMFESATNKQELQTLRGTIRRNVRRTGNIKIKSQRCGFELMSSMLRWIHMRGIEL